MSLLDPPYQSIAEYCPCTCGRASRDDFYHSPACAKLNERHPAFVAAREHVQRLRLAYYGR